MTASRDPTHKRKPPVSDAVRIQKVLADAGVASRRAAESLVEAGRVSVNGMTASIGQRVDPGTDRILVDGRLIGARPDRSYLVLNKPAGVTSTVSDRHARHTVLDLVPREVQAQAGRLYPVGRLDRDSEGLLVLTNDGDWAQRLLHPSHGVEREYAAGARTLLDNAQLQSLRDGIAMDEGIARAIGIRRSTSAEIARLPRASVQDGRDLALHWYRVTLATGWKRQVRRMFAAIGAPVDRLIRVRMGPLRLGDLAIGAVRPLTADERRALEQAVGPQRRPS
jgi:23S rRNA pseudouridine2605 synthase